MADRYYGDCGKSIFFRPLDNLPKKAVLDANVLMDTLIIQQGLGEVIIHNLSVDKFSFHTSQKSIDEVKKILQANMPDKQISSFVDRVINNAGIKVHNSDTIVKGIPPHDMHLAAVAHDINGFIISQDVVFLYHLNLANLHGRSLQEIALHYEGDKCPPELCFFGVRLGVDGYIFVKFTIDPDTNWENTPYGCLFDCPELFSIRYDGKNLILSGKGQNDFIIPYIISSNEQYALLINYSKVTDKNMHLTLKIKSVPYGTELLKTFTWKALNKPPSPENFFFLNSQYKNEGWWGTICNASYGPSTLGSKVWKAASSIIGLAPPVHTADMIRAACLLFDLKDDQVLRPKMPEVISAARFITMPLFYQGKHAKNLNQGFPYEGELSKYLDSKEAK